MIRRKNCFPICILAFVFVLFGPHSHCCKIETTSKPPCVNLPGVKVDNGAKKAVHKVSPQPVRYMDGLLMYRTEAVSFPSVGGSFSFYLTYNNSPIETDLSRDDWVGYHWHMSIPKLSFEGDRVQLIFDGQEAVDFLYDPQEDRYNGQDGIWSYILVENGYYKLVGTNGGEAVFYGPTYGLIAGQIHTSKSPHGFTWTFSYDDANGKLTQITEPSGVGWSFIYGGLNGRLSKVEVRKGQTVLCEINLEYYIYGTTDGCPGDLKKYEIVEKGNGVDIARTTYFRYYRGNSGYPGVDHDLRLVIGPMSARWAEYKEKQPIESISTDTIINEAYYDIFATYDSLHRVVFEVVRTGGSCNCGGGSEVGSYAYAYEQRQGDGDYNWPKYAVKQTNPDGSFIYVELNKVGSATTWIIEKNEQRWAWTYVYDQFGQVIEVYHPSACDATSYTFPSWSGQGVTKRTSQGLVEIFDYADPTDQYFSSYRQYCGKLLRVARRKGQQGTEQTLLEYGYIDDEGNPPEDFIPRHLRWKRVYIDDSTYTLTQYDYTFYQNDINRILTKTTYFPSVSKPSSQGASRVEHYDGDYGWLSEIHDEEGTVISFNYNTCTGLRTDKYSDATGENIYEHWDYDEWGRVVAHTLYQGSHQQTPILRRRRWVYTYLPEAQSSPNEWNYYPRFVTLQYDHLIEDDNGNVQERDGDIYVSVEDLNHRTVETAVCKIDPSQTGSPVENDFVETYPELYISDTQRAFPYGMLFQRKSFFYAGPKIQREYRWQNANLSWADANAEDNQDKLYETVYDYDSMGRLVWIKNACDTITRREYHPLGGVSAVYVSVEGQQETLVESRQYGAGGTEGLLESITRPAGSNNKEVRYSYDEWNRLKYEAVKEKADRGTWVVIKYTYDRQDRVTTLERYLGDDPSDWEKHYYEQKDSGNLWHYKEKRSYDERGRLWQTRWRFYPVTSTGLGQAGVQYVTTVWHDRVGRPIKTQEPGLLFEKLSYDGLGRIIARYISFDTDEDLSFASAGSVEGDVVLREERYEYDRAGNEILRTTYQREVEEESWGSGEPHYGALSGSLSSHSRKTYVAKWYSPSGRLIAVADYGDNGGGGAPEVPQDPPPSSDQVHVTTFEEGFGYDGGSAFYPDQKEHTSWVRATDPMGTVRMTFWDNLGRKVCVIRNYRTGGQPGWEYKEGVKVQTNVTVKYEYDGLDRATKAVAYEYVADGDITEELTKYEYGVSTSASSPYQSSSLNSNDLLFRILYGKVVNNDDSYSREIAFAYNEQGEVTWRGAGLIGSFRTQHSYSRDLLGRLERDQITSASSDVDIAIDTIRIEYDSEGRVVLVESLNGEEVVNSVARSYNKDGNLISSTQNCGISKTVSLGYETMSYQFGSETLSTTRISTLTYPEESGLARQVSYVRSGASESEDWRRKDWVTGRLSSIEDSRQEDSTRGKIRYSEYLGVGRVMQVKYGSLSTSVLSFVDSSDPSKLALDRFGRVGRLRATGFAGLVLFDYKYSYDRNGNPTSRKDAGNLDRDSNRDESYSYDYISRLIKFTPENEAERRWELTALGNWREVSDSGSAFDRRVHNERNEITNWDYKSQSMVPEYDTEGNLLESFTEDANGNFSFVYDGWNRLVAVKDGQTEVVRYWRDGFGRIVKEERPQANETYFYFYSPGWQLLSVFGVGGALLKEYIWGARYVDELLETIDYGGGSPLHRYHIQGINWNLLATVNEAGMPLEYVTYDPYGTPTFYDSSGNKTTSLTSQQGVDHLFQGRWLHLIQNESNYLRLYHFRNRTYVPILGRFLQRDKAHPYLNGYEFLNGRVLAALDPSGYKAVNIIRRLNRKLIREGEKSCRNYCRILGFTYMLRTPLGPIVKRSDLPEEEKERYRTFWDFINRILNPGFRYSHEVRYLSPTVEWHIEGGLAGQALCGGKGSTIPARITKTFSRKKGESFTINVAPQGTVRVISQVSTEKTVTISLEITVVFTTEAQCDKRLIAPALAYLKWREEIYEIAEPVTSTSAFVPVGGFEPVPVPVPPEPSEEPKKAINRMLIIGVAPCECCTEWYCKGIKGAVCPGGKKVR